jgi:hypothetical protein
LMVFLRGGKSDGWVINANLNSGFAWRPFKTNEDLFGFGAGWALPASPLLRDQYILELFYRYQLTSNLAITPDVQYILRPYLDPSYLAGQAPSCCTREKRLATPQCSAILPLRTRMTSTVSN